MPDSAEIEHERKETEEERRELTMAESDALDEVRCAIEDIIIPRNQPVELMPQVPRIIEMQVPLFWKEIISIARACFAD